LKPDAVVLVATIRAIKYNGADNLEDGFENVLAHFENLKKFNMNPIIIINKFPDDTAEDIELVKSLCEQNNMPVSVSTAFADGGLGSLDLAEQVVKLCEDSGDLKLIYDNTDSTRTKIEKIARKIYGASSVIYSEKAEKVLEQINKLGCSLLPVCMAKTQYSFSDNAKLLNRPRDFDLQVKDIIVQTGAGFIVVLTGDIMIMPGFPVKPNAEIIDVDINGNIINLS
jgi:formate--tetrahydrofolate ligase